LHYYKYEIKYKSLNRYRASIIDWHEFNWYRKIKFSTDYLKIIAILFVQNTIGDGGIGRGYCGVQFDDGRGQRAVLLDSFCVDLREIVWVRLENGTIIGWLIYNDRQRCFSLKKEMRYEI